MDVFEVMLTRRSIRKFSDAPVESAKIDMLLRSAMSAPSANNQQPWRFVCVRDSQVRQALADASPYAKMLPSAPVAIVVCAETIDLTSPDFWPQDCAAATQCMLLGAHALGLGAVWIGFYPNEGRVAAARTALGIGRESVVPFAVIALGYPAEHKERAERYDSAFVHQDRW